jgi:hypothetical protein
LRSGWRRRGIGTRWGRGGGRSSCTWRGVGRVERED